MDETASSFSGFVKRAWLTLGGFFIALLLAESALWLAGLAYSRWRLGAQAPVNDGAMRILCVGDSFTFGAGAPRGRSYPEQLQSLLDSRLGSGKAKVVNLGVPGSNSSQQLNRLELLAGSLKPHVLLIMTGWNDANLNESNFWKVCLSRMPLRRWLPIAFERGVKGRRVYRVFESIWLKLRAPDREVYRGLWQRYAGLEGRQADIALARLESRLARNPGGFRDWLALGVLLQERRRFPEALEAYRRAAVVESHNPESHFRLGYLLYYNGDRAAAYHLREALRRDPGHEIARMVLGHGKIGKAVRGWEAALLSYNLERIIGIAKGLDSRIVLQTYPSPRHPVNARIRAAFRDLSARYEVSLLDQAFRFERLANVERYFSGDQPGNLLNSHLNARGYGLVAEAACEFLISGLSRSQAHPGARAARQGPR